MGLLRYIYKAYKFLFYLFKGFLSLYLTKLKFSLNNVSYGKILSNGVPHVYVKNGLFIIGDNFSMNSGKYYNVIGRQQKCFFLVYANAILSIGDNVGMSGTAIVCYKKITIEDFVKIGGNVTIYDSDFHSLEAAQRNHIPEIYNANKKEVLIKEGAFIGAHSTILKGVVIGRNSIVGAGSVVSKSIPDNEIWAGNPAVFIRKINAQ